MICPTCKERWAPRRRDRWTVQDDPFKLIPKDEEAEKEWQKLYDNDMLVPCCSKWCSI